MQAMARYRRWQLWALEKNLLNIQHLLSTISDPAAFDRRDGGDGWTISEILGHLYDVDSAFLARARALCPRAMIRRRLLAAAKTRWSSTPVTPSKMR